MAKRCSAVSARTDKSFAAPVDNLHGRGISLPSRSRSSSHSTDGCSSAPAGLWRRWENFEDNRREMAADEVMPPAILSWEERGRTEVAFWMKTGPLLRSAMEEKLQNHRKGAWVEATIDAHGVHSRVMMSL
mmetsp:Transcript_83780/g.194906  ORF Transcript_83780/g.194906 Transcript_83780/m.194906 type:complete len:131 (+) Transcript_83780:97-489(+)